MRLPSINDSDLKNHKPNWIQKLLFDYGYINAYTKPIARKNKITGAITLRWYNETFMYWGWVDIEQSFYSYFITKSL